MPWSSHPRSWKILKGRARAMRHKPTPAEAKLWESLRGSRLNGFNFRRQHAIGIYFVDFYAPAAKLIVEVDGPVHESQIERDAERQSYLEAGRYRVIRFTNEQVLTQIDSVLGAISTALATPRI